MALKVKRNLTPLKEGADYTTRCACGWWSVDKKYGAAYHNRVHGCTRTATDFNRK